MSKYEARAEDIKAAAANYDWTISWRRQGSTVYAVVNTKKGNPLFSGYHDVLTMLRLFYKEPEVTSGGWGRWTIKVYDLLELLGENHDN